MTATPETTSIGIVRRGTGAIRNNERFKIAITLRPSNFQGTVYLKAVGQGAIIMGTRGLVNPVKIVFEAVNRGVRQIEVSAARAGDVRIEVISEDGSVLSSMDVVVEAVVNENTAVVPVQTNAVASVEESFAQIIEHMPDAILSQADALVTAQLQTSNAQVTTIQKRSLVYGAAISLSGLVTYADWQTKYRLLKTVRDESLFANHPEQAYATAEEFADAHGMSSAKYSKLMRLFGSVIPWIETNMVLPNGEHWEGIDLWSKAGQSKLDEALSWFLVAIDNPDAEGREWEPNEVQRREMLEILVAASELGIDPPSTIRNAEQAEATFRRCQRQVSSWTGARLDINKKLVNWIITNAVEEGVPVSQFRRVMRPQPVDVEATAVRGAISQVNGRQVLIVPANESLIAAINRATHGGFQIQNAAPDTALAEIIAQIFR